MFFLRLNQNESIRIMCDDVLCVNGMFMLVCLWVFKRKGASERERERFHGINISDSFYTGVFGSFRRVGDDGDLSVDSVSAGTFFVLLHGRKGDTHINRHISYSLSSRHIIELIKPPAKL